MDLQRHVEVLVAITGGGLGLVGEDMLRVGFERRYGKEEVSVLRGNMPRLVICTAKFAMK